MNSQKYSSPYLTAMPGLPSTSKAKRRSKASLSLKPNESNSSIDQALRSFSDINSFVPKQNTGSSFDTCSAGDVDQALSLLKCVKMECSTTGKVFQPNKLQTKQLAKEAITSSTEASGAVIHSYHTSPSVAENCSLDNYDNQHYDDQTGDFSSSKTTTPSSCLHNETAVILKSIMKKPSPYKDKNNSKGKNRLEPKPEVTKKPTHKSPRVKSGKNNTKETTRNPVPPKKNLEVASSSNFSGSDKTRKSPRKKISSVESKTEDKPVPEIMTKKNVKFSNKIEVYTVPYESRAGSRACDWQKNMMEQRMQSFRQLMKEAHAEDFDIFGTGMLFPGNPYHVPNPNFSIRGRGRSLISNYNFKL